MAGVVKIKKIVQGGLGLAFHEGKTLFIPYSAAGDKVRFSVRRKKKNIIFGRIEEILEPSPLRIRAECPNFGRCGGCQLLHLSYEDEIEAKKEMVAETLSRIGRIDKEFEEIIPSPERFGYRNNALFRIDGSGDRGFLAAESDELVPFPANGCLLLPEEMRAAIRSIPGDAVSSSSEALVRMDKFKEVHFWGIAGSIEPPDILMECGGFLFPLKANAFFQANRFLNERLMELVPSLAGRGSGRALDLYCGAGFFTLPLAKKGFEVTGIEGNRDGYLSAVAAAKLNNITNAKFKKGSVESEINRAGGADLVIADPPRSGMKRTVLKRIAALRPLKVILVSCDPATMARDASSLMENGFSISSIHMIDLFPGTSHTETVMLLRRK